MAKNDTIPADRNPAKDAAHPEGLPPHKARALGMEPKLEDGPKAPEKVRY